MGDGRSRCRGGSKGDNPSDLAFKRGDFTERRYRRRLLTKTGMGSYSLIVSLL